VFANAMIPPAVAEGCALIRLCVTAHHTEEQIGNIVDAFATVGRQLGVLPAVPPGEYRPVEMARSW
jgi:8-amino-7-oxononanoate synthase